MSKKKPGQVAREIEAFLREKGDPKERFVALLMERTDEARQAARDLLLEQGILHTGRVVSVRSIGDSFSGPIHQLDVVETMGTRLGEGDPKRYWMVGQPPPVGGIVDFTVTRAYPPTGKTAYAPKYELHPAGFLGNTKFLPESLIRKWITKWWIE